ncbi:MAG: Fe-S cluster assembly protein SufD [Gammaproteobacteria bacterium]
MIVSAESKYHYIEHYGEVQASLPGNQLAWLKNARDLALAAFSDKGFPSPREEEWRYTNIAPIERKRFQTPSRASGTIDTDLLKSFRIDGAAALVFVNGHFEKELSDLPDFGRGIVVCPMAEALEKHAERVEHVFGTLLKQERNGFLAFITALFTDGAFVYIPKNVAIDSAVQWIFVSTGEDSLATTRNLVIAEPGAQAEMIESHIGPEGSGYLNASVSELLLGDQARVGWAKLQSESDRGFHFGGLYARAGRGARLDHASYSFGGLLTRSEVHVDLQEAAECSLNGLFLGTGRQHVDHHTRIRHLEAHGVSRESYKGILDQRARGVFQGRIIVERDAQKTDAEMSNRNLLLSSDAEIDTKPQLEIYADDVKCAHGVTVGQLDEQSVFYLQSRGVDRESARNMLTFAFANEMVEKVKSKELRSLIQREVLASLPQTAIRKEWL